MRQKKGPITESLTNTNTARWRESECRTKSSYNVEKTFRNIKKTGNGVINRIEGLMRRNGITEFN